MTSQIQDEMKQASRRDSSMKHYPKMLEMANKMHLQMEVTKEDKTTLRGFCPFHQAHNIQNARTMKIDAKNGRFTCQFCNTVGSPVVFCAKVWGVNASDAFRLLETLKEDLGPARPKFPEEITKNGLSNSPWINSAVITRATKYYEEQLYLNFPPLRTLAKLGIEPEQAARAGVGYCTGEGLREYLLEKTDVTEDELADAPLWRPATGIEALAGRMTITDKDYTGAALWITSIRPEEEQDGHTWRPERPHNHGIPGRKPFLFGQYAVSNQTPWALFTDDPRLYIVASSNNVPTMLMTQYRQPGDNLIERCKRTADALMNRRMRHLSIAMHDREACSIIENVIAQENGNIKVTKHARQAILANLKPETRDLLKLREDSPENPE